MVPRQSGPKVCETPSQEKIKKKEKEKKKKKTNPKTLGLRECICHPGDSRKQKIGGSWSRLAWAKSETLSPK
jgi:hypothetical protein